MKRQTRINQLPAVLRIRTVLTAAPHLLHEGGFCKELFFVSLQFAFGRIVKADVTLNDSDD